LCFHRVTVVAVGQEVGFATLRLRDITLNRVF